MSENITFVNDSPTGAYAAEDTGVMVAICRDYTDIPCGVVRLTTGKYVLAPLSDLEYDDSSASGGES